MPLRALPPLLGSAHDDGGQSLANFLIILFGGPSQSENEPQSVGDKFKKKLATTMMYCP